MRWARGSYGQAVRRSLAIAGYDDLPRNGAFVLGGMANRGGSAADMIRGLGVTKQAASQLIDTLVLRGYLTREVDAEDRRRLTITLTERGRGAAETVRGAVESIDAELAAMHHAGRARRAARRPHRAGRDQPAPGSNTSTTTTTTTDQSGRSLPGGHRLQLFERLRG